MHGHLPTLRLVGIVALVFLLVPSVVLNAQQEDAENHARKTRA